MAEKIYYIFYLLIGIYLIVMSVFDFKSKEIPLIPGFVLLGVSVVTLLVSGVSPFDIAPGLMVGVFIFVVSRLSRGGVGEADAQVYLVTGAVLGFFRNAELLLISLFLAAVVSGVLIVVKRVGRKYRIPFIPFTAAGYMFVLGVKIFLN